MSDILTQIQDELDMLLHQMQSAFAYMRNRGPPATIPNQPVLPSWQELEKQNNPQNAAQTDTPATPEEFQKDIQELSKDLVLKEQQIEVLIASLPGLNSSEKEQVERMKELEGELEGIEGERVRAVEEKDELVRRVEEKIVKAGRVG